MIKNIKGVVNGKTAAGFILAVLVTLTMVFTNVEDSLPFVPPELLVTILTGIPAILTLFGIWDSAQDEFASLKEKVMSFVQDSPGIGLLVAIISQTINKIPQLGLPDGVELAALFVGGFLVVFGLKANMVSARANFKSLPVKYSKKYKPEIKIESGMAKERPVG